MDPSPGIVQQTPLADDVEARRAAFRKRIIFVFLIAIIATIIGALYYNGKALAEKTRISVS